MGSQWDQVQSKGNKAILHKIDNISAIPYLSMLWKQILYRCSSRVWIGTWKRDVMRVTDWINTWKRSNKDFSRD